METADSCKFAGFPVAHGCKYSKRHEKGRKPASIMREAAPLAGTDRSHQQHLREVTSTLQRICVGGCSSGPRSKAAASSPPYASEPCRRNQLFSERFIVQQRCSSTSGAQHPALVAMEREISSSCGAKEMQKVGRRGNSPFRQQSLPSASSLRAHSRHSKGKWQQSIPCKSSPRQPLLEKRHRIHSTPALVLSTTKSKLTLNSAPPVRSSRYDSTRTPGNSHALPKVKRDRHSSADILRENTSAYSHRIIHSQGRSQIRKSVSYDHHHGIHSSASKKRLSSCDPSPSSGCSCSNSDRSFVAAGYGIDEGSQSRAGGEERLTGESFMLEDAESSDYTSALDDINEEDDFCKGGEEDEAFFEEELTDLEEDDEGPYTGSTSEEEGSLDPITCVQRTESRGARGVDDGSERSETGSGVRPGARRLCASVYSRGELHDQTWRLKLVDSGRGKDSTAAAAAGGCLGERRPSSRETEKDYSYPASCQPSAQLVCSPRSNTQCLEPKSTLTQSKPLTTSSLEQPTAHPSLAAVTPPLRTQGLSTKARHCTSAREANDSPRGGDQPSPSLSPSLFPGVPPAIHFPLHDEKYTPLPREQRVLLKWKMSTITPNVIRSCIARAGFSKCTRGSGWLGYWGKHMKSLSFKTVKEHQKVNHFPGTFEIGRKDRLWRNLSRMQARVGKKACDFVPRTFVLPQDLRKLKREFDEGGAKQKWILKPPAAARGIGVRVVGKWSQIPKKKPVVVQRYIADPFLINGSKFDLRVYVYVPCYDPLRIYVFREGLARFATCRYSASMKSLSNRFIHLTNYSINKRNADFTPNTDETVCQGHKWGLLALWRYMRTEMGLNTDLIWEDIKDVVIRTIISSESYVTPLVKTYVRNSHSCHELFGFDIMLDRRLKPWILEVNISPSLHSNSQLDVNIKGRLVRDLLNMAAFTLPSKEVLAGEKSIVRLLSTEERAKRSHFVQKTLTESERQKVLDCLTPDDLRVLMESEDELSRCGSFERVLPSPTSARHRQFFETERYNNVLLEQYVLKYHKTPQKGISFLRKLAWQS